MSEQIDRHALGLCDFIDASPSPYHAVASARAQLTAAGFVEVAEADAWPREPGRYLTIREGSVVAWSTEAASMAAHTPYRIVGGHTDSPNLRIKPQPDIARLGWEQLAVETYGGPLFNSWLDRDLGLSGRVAVREPGAAHGVAMRLWRIDEPILRVPQLAIHLERGVNEDGLRLNPQTQLVPVWGVGDGTPCFRDWLAAQLEVPAADVLTWDLMTHDLTPARRIGRDRELIAAGRLDNLTTCYAGTQALLAACDAIESGSPAAREGAGGAGQALSGHIPVLVLFDHEEIGSQTNRGADSQLLTAVLERIVAGRGGTREDLLRALSASLVCSADMAHAVHPNYVDRFDPQHLIMIGGGPAVKTNVKGRYATDAAGAAAVFLAAEAAGVAVQQFVSRGDMLCGSTIGPMTAALSGAVTVDIGAPMLSMHSARELMAAADVASYVTLLTAILAARAG